MWALESRAASRRWLCSPGGCGQSGRSKEGKTESKEGHRRGHVTAGGKSAIGKADLKVSDSASGPLQFRVDRTGKGNWMFIINMYLISQKTLA